VSCISSGTGLTLVTPTVAPTPSYPGSAITSAPVATPATTYACNPAHSYPGGVSCIFSGTGLTFVTPTVAPTSSAPGSAITSAPVATPATTYACNPAHSYPGGASCISSGTGLTLITPTVAPTSSAPGSAITSAPVATPATTYTCNPAHSYPGGASCISSGTGLTLVTPTVAPTPSASGSAITSAPVASSATTYACNPAHSYPGGASCISSGTGLTLVTPTTAPASSAPAPSASAPAAGACAPGLGSNNYEYPRE